MSDSPSPEALTQARAELKREAPWNVLEAEPSSDLVQERATVIGLRRQLAEQEARAEAADRVAIRRLEERDDAREQIDAVRRALGCKVGESLDTASVVALLLANNITGDLADAVELIRSEHAAALEVSEDKRRHVERLIDTIQGRAHYGRNEFANGMAHRGYEALRLIANWCDEYTGHLLEEDRVATDLEDSEAKRKALHEALEGSQAALAAERERAERAERALAWHSPKHDGLDHQRHGGPHPEADSAWLNIEFRCTCGSGAHPRRCGRHPLGWRLHTAELRDDMAFADEDDRGPVALDTTRTALEASQAQRKALREALEGWVRDATAPDGTCFDCGAIDPEHCMTCEQLRDSHAALDADSKDIR